VHPVATTARSNPFWSNASRSNNSRSKTSRSNIQGHIEYSNQTTRSTSLDSLSPLGRSHEPEPRLTRAQVFPARKRVIFTNFSSGGAMRNIPHKGDGLGSLVGRMLTRNILTETVGATAGLVLFGGLYGLGLMFAAMNVRSSANTKIKNNTALKQNLINNYRHYDGPSGQNHSPIRTAVGVIDKTISSHKSQKKEAYGLWAATAGSFIGPVSRAVQLFTSVPLTTLTALTGGLVGFGLGAFGLVQFYNDVRKLGEIKKIANTIDQKLAEGDSGVSQTEAELIFNEKYQKFFKKYERLLKWSSVNSAVLTGTAAALPIGTAVTLGAGMPVLASVAGVSGFIRFTVIEPKLDKMSFKPISAPWAEIYNEEDGVSRAQSYVDLTQLKSTIVQSKAELKSFVSMRDKAFIKAAKMMSVFPFLSGVSNKAYEALVSKKLSQMKGPEAFHQQSNIQLNLMSDVLSQIDSFQATKAQTIERHIDRLQREGLDRYGEKTSELRSQLRDIEYERFGLSKLKDSANTL